MPRLTIAALALLASWYTAHASSAAGTATLPRPLPSFEARLASSEVFLARPFTLCIVARHLEGTSIEWPVTLRLGELFEEVERKVEVARADGDAWRSELCAQLLAFDTALSEIPAIEINYDLGQGELLAQWTAPLTIRVSGPIGTDEPMLRDPAQPVGAMVRDWRSIALGLATLIAAGLLALLWRTRSRARVAQAGSQVSHPLHLLPAHEEALARLDALEASGALDAAELKPCFLEMSEIFRSYLGRRFQFSAMDLTSAEIHSRLMGMAGSEEWLTTVERWLSRCDLVKYANTEADPEEAREALYGARVLVEQTHGQAHSKASEVLGA